MKDEKIRSFLTAWALSFALAFGAVGCIATAFSLESVNLFRLGAACCLLAAVWSLCWQWKRGWAAIACLLALTTGYLWRQGELLEQTGALLYQMTRLYDRAYGLGVVVLPPTAGITGQFQLPLTVLAGLLALLASGAVCRGRGTWLAALSAVLAAASCFVVTDTVPEEGTLFLLMAGMLLLLLPAEVRRTSPYQADRLAGLAAVPVLLALGALFLAVPREGYVNQAAELQQRLADFVQELPSALEEAAENITADPAPQEPDQVDLAGLGRRIQSRAAVMEVTADTGGFLYLRGQDYDSYDGRGWNTSPHRVEGFSASGPDLGTVTIRTFRELDVVYLPYYPAGGRSLVGGKIDNTRLSTQYTVSCQGLSGGGGAAPEGYRELPEGTRAGAEALLATVLSGEDTAAAKAQAIAAFVRSSAEYDLDPGKMPGEWSDFALWFLNEGDKGYCVHFATAATVLLRAAEVPARYVTGYAAEVVPGEPATLTGENAHAWAEYFDPQYGAWVILEATPGAFQGTQPVETAPARPETDPPERPTREPQAETTAPDQEVPPGSVSGPTAPEPPEPANSGKGFGWLLLLPGLALLLEGQRRLRRSLGRRACRTGSPNAQALARWQEAESLARLLRQPPPEELRLLAQKAKFSQHTLAPEELAQFDAYCHGAVRTLKKRPWYLGMVYAYVFAAY